MKHTIELQPFQVPDFVLPVSRIGRRQDGYVATPGISLSDLDVETLEEMCAVFRLEVFAKANMTPNV